MGRSKSGKVRQEEKIKKAKRRKMISVMVSFIVAAAVAGILAFIVMSDINKDSDSQSNGHSVHDNCAAGC